MARIFIAHPPAAPFAFSRLKKYICPSNELNALCAAAAARGHVCPELILPDCAYYSYARGAATSAALLAIGE